MINCSPQRYLANNRNALRTAVLTPSSVQAVDNSVLAIPFARRGTAQVLLTGSYTGAEEATYDIEIVDASIGTNLISAPIFAGAGSGKLLYVVASGTPQNYAVELADAGTPARDAFVDFDGVQIVARTIGAVGNSIRLEINQSALVFTPTTFSLLDDLKVGAGSDTSGLEGSAFDWDTAVIGSDDQIPTPAHRVAFGSDTSVIYLAYKRFAGTKWTYHFVPEIKRDVVKGTVVNFVTGGRVVTVTDGGTPPEVFSGIVTVYDLLEALKTGSVLVDIAGVVANDRSPAGQAARELALRTDAHVEPSYGSGGSAIGFVDTFANADAGTELVTATCFAITGKDNPNARLGKEMWRVRGSLSGELAATALTGVPYNGPQWGFTIPRKLPDNYGAPKGRISAQVNYVSRSVGVDPPPICIAGMALGPDASDGSITFRYTKRPTGDCLCKSMPVPNLHTACLGLFGEGGPHMGYNTATRTRLIDMYGWQADVVRNHSQYSPGRTFNEEDPFIANGLPPNAFDGTTGTSAIQEGLISLCANFESVLAEIDAIDPTGGTPADPLQTAGYAAWDTALAELKADVAGTGAGKTATISAAENLSAGNAVSTYIDNAGVLKVRKAVPGGLQYGFVLAGVTSGTNATVYFWGTVVSASGGGSFVPGTSYVPILATPGNWGTATGIGPFASAAGIIGVAVTTTDLIVLSNAVYLGLLADRYENRLKWVGISAGIPQVGKTDADSITSGDGCWRDWGDAYYWEAVGSDYAPAFNNHPYYSSRLASDGKRYFSTHEFAFQPNIKCPAGLLEGDSFTVNIGDAGSSTTYQVGDVLTLPVIAAQPFYLAGGQDGNDLQKWFVSGSVDGPFAQFTYSLAAGLPHSYSSGGLAFDIEPGGIPFEKGDRYTFGVEGAHYHWRKNGSAWSSTLPVPLTVTALDSGLSIAFTTGAAPSFVAADMFKFRALQPWAVSNIQSPLPDRWQWTGATPTMIADFGAPQTLDMAAIALHTLPAGATITIEGGTAPGVYTWLETLTQRPGVIFGAFGATRTARYVRLSLTGATDAGIGWWWIGQGLTTELSASIQLRRAYKVIRGSAGLRNVGRFIGKAVSGDIEWSEGAISEADRVAILELTDWVKENDDEPFILVPQVTRPDEAVLAQIISDEVDIVDISDYNRDIAYPRRFSAKIPLAGVW